MISLKPPFRVIDGFTILSDHEDESLFHLLPSTPHLQLDEDGRPCFNLTEYLGGGAGAKRISGGILTMTLELGVDPGVIEGIASKLQEEIQGSTSGPITLTPVLFESGSVQIIAMGENSTTPQDVSGNKSESPFQVSILGSGKPSLDTRNSASFQLILDANSAQLIEKCIENPTLPITAIYRMNFSGIRPSFEARITADWSKVFKQLEQKADANLYIVKADAESMVSEAVENSVINIEMTVTGSDDASRSTAEKARSQLVEWVLENLCRPMIQKDSAASITRAIDDTVTSLVRTLVPGVSYQIRQLDETQLRHMAVTMDQSLAVLQEVVPQGALGSLLRDFMYDADGEPLPDIEESRARFISKVDLDGFPRLEVKVGVEDRFIGDGLSEVVVDVTRSSTDGSVESPVSFLFRDASTMKDYVVNLLEEEGADLSEPYRYRFEVRFDPASSFGRHEPLCSEWLPGRTTELFVEPRLVYALREITFAVSPTFSFDLYPAVSIETSYSEENGSAQLGRLKLDNQTLKATWKYRAHTIDETRFEYRVTYHRKPGAGEDISLQSISDCRDWIAIGDPLPRKRQITIISSLPWSEISLAFVRMKYEDKGHDIGYDEQIDLTPESRFIRRDYPISEDGPTRILYRLTILFANGGLIDGSWRETEDERLVVDRRLVDQKCMRVQCIGGSLEEAKLTAVKLFMEVREPGDGKIRHSKEFIVSGEAGSTATGTWEFLLGDPSVGTVHFQGAFIAKDGFVTRTEWESTDADLLVIHLGRKTVTG